jgi:L-iditol 2-dehydrogenase
MKVAYLSEIKKFKIDSAPDPSIKSDEVMVGIESVGICGSDVHYWHDGCIGNVKQNFPCILGHEPAGVILDVGKDVDTLKVGDRVAVEPGLSCGKCRMCIQGRHNCCPNVEFLGSPGMPGAFQEYLPRKVEQCHVLPESMSFDDGALMEPFTVALHALLQSNFKVGMSAAVLGAGPVGLAIATCLDIAGATNIFIGENNPWRIEKAKKLNLGPVYNTDDRFFLNSIAEDTKGQGVDIVFEAAGSADTFYQSLEAACIGGTVMLVGICDREDIPMPMHIARRKELKIYLSRRDNNEYGKMIALANRKKLPLNDFVTGHFSLNDLQSAFVGVHEKHDGVMKTIINVME